MTVKKFVFNAHQILGLATGIVVFIVSITGCCWVFKTDIESFYDDYKTVPPQAGSFITPTEAYDIAKELFPDNTIHGTIFGQTNEAIEVVFYDKKPEFYTTVFLNPYTGEVIRVNDNLSGFFAFILKGHMRLWLPRYIGEHVVGAAILVFIIIIITGFILWLPKRLKNLKQRTRFNWQSSTRWKRKNFDLHTILGFYVCTFALILAFTGSMLSYNWLKYVVYKSLGGDKEARFIIPDNASLPEDNTKIKPIDLLITKLRDELPHAVAYEVHYPKSDKESIYVEVTNSKNLYYDSDFRFYDQYTLEELSTPAIYGKYKDAKLADKILRMTYDIHIGTIGGTAGKIIAFISSLLIATLPVTGVFLWFGRKYK